jgi:hypothetical protein
MTGHQKIRADAQLVLNELRPLIGLGVVFGYNRESVQAMDGFIERKRAKVDFAPDVLEDWVQLLGSFLGECIIHTYGGEWREEDDNWGVFFNNSNAAFPFSKVRKQLQNGAAGGDSVLGFFDLIGPVILKNP